MKKILIVVLPALIVCAPAVYGDPVQTAPGSEQTASAQEKQREVVREYYEDGTLKSETYYFNGQKDGKHNEYYPNGVKSRELTYENGILDGRARWYNPDGTVRVTVRVRDGQITVGSKYDAAGGREHLTTEEIAEYQNEL